MSYLWFSLASLDNYHHICLYTRIRANICMISCSMPSLRGRVCACDEQKQGRREDQLICELSLLLEFISSLRCFVHNILREEHTKLRCSQAVVSASLVVWFQSGTLHLLNHTRDGSSHTLGWAILSV